VRIAAVTILGLFHLNEGTLSRFNWEVLDFVTNEVDTLLNSSQQGNAIHLVIHQWWSTS